MFILSLLSLSAALTTTPGEVTTPFPTINHLAVEWQIEGDENLNATCLVKYRKEGELAWQEAQPLRRVPAGKSQKTSPIFTWTNRFSGSVFDLEPRTPYEIELKLHDPDGGSATKTVRASTRPEPGFGADATPKHGSKATLNTVEPGDLILLADGDYGAVTFNRDGEPEKPIIYRSASGNAVFCEISLTNRKWVYLEGVKVNGPVRLNGTAHCVVRRCNLRSQFGIKAYKPGMMNACIEDNTIIGIHEWRPEIMGAGGENDGEGIQFTGSGNVIRYNLVSGFRDCISHMEDDGVVPQTCNDILNNDLSIGLDDGIEADFAQHNCRVLRNRLTNCFVGISSQPSLGGPNYYIRNVMFNLTYSAFKLHRFSVGDVILHNTVVKTGDGFGNYTSEPFDHALIQNNLFIGGPSIDMKFGGYSPGRGRVVDVQSFGSHCVLNFNAYATMGSVFEGKILKWTFRSLPGTEYEANGIQTSVEMLSSPVLIQDPAKLFEPPDLRPRPGSNIVDAAKSMPNVNDTSDRSGADIGAYESGQTLPVYGPRPQLNAH